MTSPGGLRYPCPLLGALESSVNSTTSNPAKKIVPGLVLAALAFGGAYYVTQGPAAPAGRKALLELFPGDATAAFLMPDVGGALVDVKALKDRFKVHVAALAPLLAEGSRLAGFNLEDPKTMKEIGLVPGGGFGAAAGPDWAALAFAVGDRSKFEAYVKARFEGEVGSALVWDDAEREGLKVRLARSGDADVFGLVYLRGHAVVAPTQDWEGRPVDPAKSLSKVAKTTRETSLASRADLADPLGRIGEGAAAYLLTDLAASAGLGADAAEAAKRPRDAEALRKAAGQVRGFALGVHIGADGLRMPFALGGTPEAAKALVQGFRPLAKGPDYAQLAPPDGLLLVSAAFNPQGIVPWLRSVLLEYERKVVDKTIKEAGEVGGKDLEKDLLPLLSGHVAFVFQNLDVATLGQRLLRNLGASATVAAEQPGAITTTTFVGLKDAARTLALIEGAVAEAEAKAGGPLPNLERVEGRGAWRLKKEGREVVGFGVEGDVLVITTGVDGLDGALARIGSKDAKGLGSQVVASAARRGLSSDNTISILLSTPVIFRNFPVLNLWRPAAPARELAEVVARARVVEAGVDGEILAAVKPPPPPAGASK